MPKRKELKKVILNIGGTDGIGKGDGIEASELNNVRGEIKAARKVFENKKCTTNK